MGDVAMPRLSDSMEEGTILKWLKSDGDDVAKGEELVEIETDKADMTYEADESGTLSIVAKEGDTLPVGETICTLGEGGGGSSDDEESEDEDEPAAEAEDDSEEEDDSGDEPEDDPDEQDDSEDEATDEGSGENGRLKASPIARRMAREAGLELAEVKGSGPGGRIVKADVE